MCFHRRVRSAECDGIVFEFGVDVTWRGQKVFEKLVAGSVRLRDGGFAPDVAFGSLRLGQRWNVGGLPMTSGCEKCKRESETNWASHRARKGYAGQQCGVNRGYEVL